MAIKERPGLIISDVMMPKISGFDMLDILRSTTETRDIRVIMMTALSSEDQRQRGEQLGADRYLVKSQVGIEDVVRTVHDVLQDAPTASTPAQQPFAQPAGPSAIARPAPAPVVPPRQDVAPAPQQSVPMPPASTGPLSPQAPQPQYAPQTPTSPQPIQQPAPSPVATTPSLNPVSPPAPSTQPPQNSSLPQPTAPFSTQRPAGLADRVIHPLERDPDAAENQPLDELMARELGNAPAPQESIAPVIPAPQPPTPPNLSPDQDQHGISFEETPRQPGPQA